MAYKIQIENNFFVLIDTSTSFEIIREVRDQVKFSVSTTVYKFKWNYANAPDVSKEIVTEFDFSNIVDSGGIAFASQAVLNAFLSSNIGHINDLDVPIVIDETIIDNGTNSTLLRNEGGVVGDTDYTVPKTDGTSGQVLQTNGAGVVTWQTLATGITVGTTAVTSGTVGRVFFQGTGDVVQQSSSLFWDNTNSRLGVGATPATTVRLDVRAQGALSTDIAFRVRNSADTANIAVLNGDFSGNYAKLGIGLSSGVPILHNIDALYASGTAPNISLGTSTLAIREGANSFVRFIGSGVRSIAVSNGAANTGLGDAFEMYSADIIGGNAAPHFRTENGSIVKLYQNAAVTTPQGLADALTNLGLLAASTIVNSIPTHDGPTYDTNAIQTLTAAEYAAIGTPNASTLYFIV